MAGALLYSWKKWHGAPNPTMTEWRAAGFIGILMLGGGMGLTAVGQQYISSGLTAVFIACSPMILSFCTGFFGEWPNKREWLGIFLGFAGAILLAAGDEFSAQPMGIAALLAAIICWNIGSVLSQRKYTLAPGAMGFASEMLLGGVFLIIIALFNGESFHTPMTVKALAAWSYLVVAGSLLAFTAYMFLLSKVSSALASSYAYVNPLIAVTLGVLIGGENLSTREILAMVIILSSVALITVSHTAKQTSD